jgi:hypothetical protein
LCLPKTAHTLHSSHTFEREREREREEDRKKERKKEKKKKPKEDDEEERFRSGDILDLALPLGGCHNRWFG